MDLNKDMILLKNVFSIFINVSFSVLGILISMLSNKRKKLIENEFLEEYTERTESLVEKIFGKIKEIFLNYKKSKLEEKSYDILKKLNLIRKINLEKEEETEEINEKLLLFKTSIKKNLVNRYKWTDYLNLTTSIFIFFQILMFFIPIFNKGEENKDSEKYIGFFMSFFGQIFSFTFSYLAIVIDNINFLHESCDSLYKYIESDELNCISLKERLEEIEFAINNPIKIIFKSETDLEKQK